MVMVMVRVRVAVAVAAVAWAAQQRPWLFSSAQRKHLHHPPPPLPLLLYTRISSLIIIIINIIISLLASHGSHTQQCWSVWCVHGSSTKRGQELLTGDEYIHEYGTHIYMQGRVDSI